MKIRPKIPKFQNGGVPQWYLNRYGNRTSLLGWNSNLRYNYANLNLNANDHRNAGNLDTVYRKNMAYIGTPGAVSSDILSFYNSDANGMSALEFVNFYNKNAGDIRKHWALNLTYGKDSAGSHNRLFRRMFQSRSNQLESPGSDYNIGYLLGRTKGGYDIQDIEGSSTWLRRMDLYENEFDPNNPDSNRLHKITLKDGTKAIVYKKANGDIGLYNSTQQESPNNPPSENPQKPNPLPQQTEGGTEVGGSGGGDKKETPLQQGNDLLGRLRGMIPGLLSTGRLAGNLINSARVYDEVLKGIKPTLLQPYYTHRQVVGDEATKQAYYRRAIAGLTKAAQPFTSDADRQMAYMQEARRAGDELKALGDLADNLEIRRTSDESNQHQWANTQRATEVANTNLASLNDANEKKHTLLALKHSALWSSIDNYLKEIETRKRLLMEEDNAYNKLIDLLDLENELTNDPNITSARDTLYALRDKDTGRWDENSQAYKDAKAKYDAAVFNAKKKYYVGLAGVNRKYKSPFFIKSGSKITYKKDDKLLYKSTKDVVDHFRRMCRRYPEKERKIQPLAPHPDGTRRKKYLTGGQFLAPFTIYTPAVGAGETSRTVSQDTGTSTKSSLSSLKDSTLKDMLDLIKMFKDVKGIKVDVNSIYKNIASVLLLAEVFGKEINSLLMASMYLRAMLQLNNVSRSKEIYDKAYDRVVANDALNEIATNSLGYYAVQNKDTKEIDFVKEIDPEKYVPLTNSLLLTLREFSPNLSFEKGDEVMQQVIANGIGINKIGKEIKDLVSRLGSTDDTIEGLTKVESSKIKGGLQALSNPDKVKMLYALETAPDGDYKFSAETKNLVNQMKAALKYLENMLPENYKAVMNVHGGVKQNIMMYLGSLIDETNKLQVNPLTGKASDKNGSGGKSSAGSDITPAMALSMGLGERETFIISDKTSDGLKVSAINLPLLDSNHHAMAVATLNLVGSGDYAGQLLLNSATMGGVKVSPEGINDVLISEGRIHAAELPIDMAEYLSTGIIKPNLNFLKSIEKADELVRQAGITNRDNLTAEQIKTINDIYSKNNLPIIYTLDSKGKPILTSEYRRFALMKATAPESSFEEELSFNDGVIEASDDDRTRFEAMMKQVTGNDKYSLDNGISIWGIGRLSGTNLYKGTIYIPMTESHISALASTGFKASPEEYNLIDALDLLALFIRSSGFTSAGSFTK